MEARKVVLDTNVVITAAINPFGSSGKVMDLIVGKKVVSYTSEAILEELRFKLTSEKVLKYLESRVYALWIYRVFRASSIVVNPRVRFEVSPDSEDNKFFDVVYSAKADFLISLDKKHVLKLRDENGRFALKGHEFLILTPAEFLEVVGRHDNP
ncbi:putative toxin-antitoxin system toxin component, PIN family [Thermococcus gammatolerans]|uniref:Nucleotide binding protein, putative, containing PIN domain n=1 Tax=Thermococcus gammatolerans (strain DSM 15229 / JCM 11827 / EJ3) TaxID=593117 RepID=C5A3Q3_THEGJ|nr:putative toxin-antitoxin system toxin component, PIN family [Thermococcus gammatolerans]ACS32865.1 Nucleotide binding protein, putative, containing PIN domain [Thermococcus gammatolerans EJ3]